MCHVAMVAKFLDLNTTVCSVLQIWYKTTKKLTCMTFLCMIAYRNKAVTKKDTGTTQQQNDQTSHCGAHVLTESTREWGILVLVMY